MKNEKSKNNCPVCDKPTESDNQHDALCDDCGFNIVKRNDDLKTEAV
jgi:predicted amidophosphoribosyltransferase